MSSIFAEEKIKRFRSFQPARFRYLLRLTMEILPAWDGTVSRDVEVVLSDALLPESRRLKLKFINSSDVKIGSLWCLGGCVIEIRDISDRQLESTTYSVADVEEHDFSLNCQDFEFEVTNQPA